jgi:hypothetical protein
MRCLRIHVLIPKQWFGFLSVSNFQIPYPWKQCFVISWFPGINLSKATCLPIRFLQMAHMPQHFKMEMWHNFDMVIFGKEHKSWSSLLHNFLQFPYISVSTLNLSSSLTVKGRVSQPYTIQLNHGTMSMASNEDSIIVIKPMETAAS